MQKGPLKNEVLVTHTVRCYSPASHYKGLSVQFHFCPCVNSGGQVGKGAGSSLSTSAFPCHYHSTNAHLPHFRHLLLELKNFIKVIKQNNSLSIILDHIAMSTTYLITIKYGVLSSQPIQAQSHHSNCTRRATSLLINPNRKDAYITNTSEKR